MLVQEYGRYFGMQTACFRGGCLTGPNHSGTQLHGFLAYLMKCAVTGTPYTVFGYSGKQVRDNIHSADLIAAFDAVLPRPAPRRGLQHRRRPLQQLLDAGGHRASAKQITGRPLDWTYADDNRIGDHIWWISDIRQFEAHYPDWRLKYDISGILLEIYEHNRERWRTPDAARQLAFA